MKLDWYIYEYDDNDNPTYAASSRIGDEDDGPFTYRLKPVLRDLKIEWDNVSDSETASIDLGPWLDLEEAKAELEKEDALWLLSLAEEGE